MHIKEVCMKLIISILLIILLFTPQCSAGSDLNPINIGATMIADGADMSIIRTADSLMDWVCGKNETTGNTTTKDTPPSVTQLITGFATWSVTPLQYPSVVKIMGMSLCCAAVFMILYAFAGGAYVAVSGATNRKYDTLKFLLNSDSSERAASNYAKNILIGCLAISFIVLVIFITLLIAYVLKSMIMSSIADSISPSMASVPVLYLAMAIMWVCVSIFFGISNIVICLTAAFSFVLGALYASDRTKHITVGWMGYFGGMVFMQVFVITIVAVTVGVIMDIKTGEYGNMLTPNMEMSLYIALILFVMGSCVIFVAGRARLLKTAKTVVKLVV